MSIKLISRKNLEKLIEADPEQRDYSTSKYYDSMFKFLYLKRIKLGLKLLGDKKYQRMLDVGFGGGVITPELAQHAQEYFGVDVHKNIDLVREILLAEGVENINLQHAADNLPFEDNYFDCVWCMSVLEFIDQPEKTIAEIKRVARDDAKIVLGFPVENKLTNLAYKLIGFKSAEAHKSNHQELLRLIKKYFQIKKTKQILGLFMVVEVI